MAYLVGLTGGIGSGKTVVSDLFAQFGIDIIDTDVISHQLTAAGGLAIPQILEAFGAPAIDTDGSMNRKIIRQLVFSDPSEKKRLEAILHPLIHQQALIQIEQSRPPYCVVVIPLLLNSNFWRKQVNRILVVDAPIDSQITRVQKRSGLSPDQIKKILSSQNSRQERLDAADDIICNCGSVENLEACVRQLDQKYRQLGR